MLRNLIRRQLGQRDSPRENRCVTKRERESAPFAALRGDVLRTVNRSLSKEGRHFGFVVRRECLFDDADGRDRLPIDRPIEADQVSGTDTARLGATEIGFDQRIPERFGSG